jgi:rhodanese-related sulfurtransferase
VSSSTPRRRTIDELLAAARARLDRLSPAEALAAMHHGAALIDIRSQDQRRASGVIPGSYWFPRNVLEWRVDPASSAAHPAVSDPGRQAVLLCAQGYQTSLAAVVLQDLGFARATDVIGGFAGWAAAGLPVEPFDPARHEAEGGPV